jgi:hypothetical protein
MELLAWRLKLFAIAALFERTIVKTSDLGSPPMWTFSDIFDTVVTPQYWVSRQF